MNYDELISGYFDGELTPEEDEALRQEIANNPELKANFDDAVFMHYALRNDAQSLDVPEDLKRNTHDLVMMRMLADKQNYLPKSEEILSARNAKTSSQEPKLTIVKQRHSARHFVASVVAVLILGFVNISEYSLFRHLNELYTYQNVHFDVSNINQKNQNTINTKIVYRNIITREKANSQVNTTEQITDEGGANIDNSVDIQAKTEATQNNETNSSNSEEMSMLAQVTPIVSNANANVISNASSTSNANSSSEITYDNILNVLGTSNSDNTNNIDNINNHKTNNEGTVNNFFVANSNPTSPKAMQSMLKAGTNDIVSFSRNFEEPSSWINANKMGRFGDNSNVNLELKSYYAGSSVFNSYMNSEHSISIGFSQSIGYSLDSKHKFGIEVGNINQRAKRMEMIEVPYQQFYCGDTPLDPSPKTFLPYERENNINYLWGTLFYEYNFIADGNFNLDGRINIGANGKGAMNIFRLTASYTVFNAINLSIGLDNRSFFVNNLTKTTGKNLFINSLSLIYGIEFSF